MRAPSIRCATRRGRPAFLAPFVLALLASSSIAQNEPDLAQGATTARPLPEQVVICIDRASARCWSVASEDQCRTAAGAQVFRALPRGEGSVSHGPALADCWKSVGQPRPQ